MDVNFNFEKFKSLVHYICWRCADPTKLGAVKLNKVLWRADFRAYLELGEAVTGDRYVKRQYGPVPASILGALRELEVEGKLSIREVEYYDNPKKEFFALNRPDLSLFTPDEISLIDEAIEYVTEKHTARSISEESHDRIWELARIGEEIPYYTVFSKPAEITVDDIEWAKTKIAELQD
jgi:Protein of unknown function (DUF4065)